MAAGRRTQRDSERKAGKSGESRRVEFRDVTFPFVGQQGRASWKKSDDGRRRLHETTFITAPQQWTIITIKADSPPSFSSPQIGLAGRGVLIPARIAQHPIPRGPCGERRTFLARLYGDKQSSRIFGSTSAWHRKSRYTELYYGHADCFIPEVINLV